MEIVLIALLLIISTVLMSATSLVFGAEHLTPAELPTYKKFIFAGMGILGAGLWVVFVGYWALIPVAASVLSYVALRRMKTTTPPSAE